MLLAKRGPPRVNEGSPSRACMKMAHGGVVEDSANGDGQLEDFDGDNCDGRFAYGLRSLSQRAKYFCTKGADLYYVGGSSSKFTVLVFKGICSVT